MKLILNIIFLIITISVYSQSLRVIKKMEGVWIAEDYYNDFIKTKSAIASKKSFEHSNYVGLRINTKEKTNREINIGVSVLHSHLLYPEVSEYTIINEDTVYEQGFFKIILNQKDSLGYVVTSNNDLIHFDSKNKEITLIRRATKYSKRTITKYKRISDSFESDYEFPNPIYYFTTQICLKGTYIVKDSSGNIIERDLIINSKGIVSSKHLFNGQKAYFSTDVYCGPPIKEDFVLFCDSVFSNDLDCQGYVYKISNNSDFKLYTRKWITKNGIEKFELGECKYEFVKIE